MRLSGTIVKEGCVEKFVGVAEVKQLLPIHAVKVYKNPTEVDGSSTGIQRVPTKSHINEIKAYIQNRQMRTFPSMSYADVDGIVNIQNGYAIIPDNGKIWSVDGNHRFCAFHSLIVEDGKKEYENEAIVVEIFLKVDGKTITELQAGKFFDDINSKQKKISRDNREALRTRLIEEGETDPEDDIPRAVCYKTAFRLGADENSPLFGLVQGANERMYRKAEFLKDPSLKHKSVLKQGALTEGLLSLYKTAVADKDAPFQSQVDELYPLAFVFWEAVQQVIPVVFNKARDYCIFKTQCISCTMLAADIWTSLQKHNIPFTTDNVAKILETSHSLCSPDFWRSGKSGGEAILNHGKDGCERLYQKIRREIKFPKGR